MLEMEATIPSLLWLRMCGNEAFIQKGKGGGADLEDAENECIITYDVS